MRANHPFTRLALAFSFICAGSAAHAQQSPKEALPAYPTKPVRVLVGNAPGGGSDISARTVAHKLTELWGGNPVIVDNRPGASGIIAFELVAKAPPDGYTLLVASSSSLASAMAQRKLSFDIRRDYAALTQLTSQVLLLVSGPAMQLATLKDLIAHAKAKPGTLNLGSSGTGSIAHAALELFNTMANVSIVHVPYKGIGPALTDMLSGQLQLAMPTSVSGMPHVKAGKLKALASTGATRLHALPDVPTFSESGVPLELDDWFGAYTTSRTPAAIVSLLHRDITKALASSDVKARFGATEVTPSATPAEAAKKIANDVARWERIVKIPSFASALQ